MLRDAAGTELRRLPTAALRADAPLGRLQRRVELPDGGVFLTDDADGLDALIGRARGGLLHAGEQFHPRLALVVAAALGLVALLWRFGLPALVTVAVWATPPGLKGQMDAGTMAVVDRLGGETRLSAAEQARTRAVFDAIVAAAPPPPPGVDYALVLQDSQLGTNAFALPGGTVLVTDDLVRAVEGDVDALAGVMAHEVVHVQEAHGLQGLYRSLGLYLVVGLIAGDTGPLLDEALLEGNALLSLAGTRAFEREADAGAIVLMEAAGYDPEGLARFFALLLEEFGDTGGWASSHPGTAERLDAVRAATGD